MLRQETRLPSPRHERPALELLIVRSSRRPHRLTLRLADGDHSRSGEVMEALAPAGFLEGDRVTIELLAKAGFESGGAAVQLDVMVLRSSVDPSRLTLRCLDDALDANEVMERLYPAGFRPADR